jgi:hypothetical protein
VNDIVIIWTPSQDKWPSTCSLKHEINIKRKEELKEMDKKMGLEKVHRKRRCHTPSTKAPINEIIRALVCHETH